MRVAGYDRPHMLQMGFVYELPFAANSSSVLAQIVKHWQVSGIGSWMSGRPFTVGGDNGLLQQAGGQQTINITGRCGAWLRHGGAERAVVRPVRLRAAGKRLGQHRTERVPRAVELQPRCLAVPGDSVRPLSARNPGRVAELAQPSAMGHPGHGRHRSELHADPGFRQQSRAANRATGRSVRVLSVVACCARGVSPPRARPAAGQLRPVLNRHGCGECREDRLGMAEYV